MQGQTSPEYLLIIVTAVVIAALIYFVLSQAVFKPQLKEANESSSNISKWIKIANTSSVINTLALKLLFTLNFNAINLKK